MRRLLITTKGEQRGARVPSERCLLVLMTCRLGLVYPIRIGLFTDVPACTWGGGWLLPLGLLLTAARVCIRAACCSSVEEGVEELQRPIPGRVWESGEHPDSP